MSSFHGGIGAAVIFGGLIIGSDIRTANTPPYWEMGPTTTQPYLAGQYPAIQAVSVNTARYDLADPALIYVDDSLSQKLLILEGGNATVDAKTGAQLQLWSTDPAVGSPGAAQLYGQTVYLGTALTSIDLGFLNPGKITFLGNLIDQHANPIPSFQQITGNYVTAGAGLLTIPHGFATVAVLPLVLEASGNYTLVLNSRTVNNVVLQAIVASTGVGAPAGTNIAIFGYITNPAG